MKVLTDPARLRRPSEPVKSRAEGGAIARKLFACLRGHNARARKGVAPNAGIGLAAPQVGIFKQVFVLLVDTPLAVMNPVVLRTSGVRVPFTEGCLSMPGKSVNTYRHLWVELDTLNLGPLLFGPREPGQSGARSGLLAAVAAQHEYDHLLGVLCDERQEDRDEPVVGKNGLGVHLGRGDF